MSILRTILWLGAYLGLAKLVRTIGVTNVEDVLKEDEEWEKDFAEGNDLEDYDEED